MPLAALNGITDPPRETFALTALSGLSGVSRVLTRRAVKLQSRPFSCLSLIKFTKVYALVLRLRLDYADCHQAVTRLCYPPVG